MDNTKWTCSICLDNNDYPMVINCGHTFGEKCIKREVKCPICTTKIDYIKPNYYVGSNSNLEYHIDIPPKIEVPNVELENQTEVEQLNIEDDFHRVILRNDCKRIIKRVSCCGFYWLVFAIVNWIMVDYWYYPALHPPTYSQYNCDIYSCKSELIASTSYVHTNIHIKYGINGYYTYSDFNINGIIDYCNITNKIECYYYDDNPKSLTLNWEDLQYKGDSGTEILVMIICLFNLLVIPLFGLGLELIHEMFCIY